MASNPNPNRERADSAIDGIDSVSKTLITAQNLRTAVSLFASDTAVQAFTELLELFSKREKDLEARERTIRDLDKELAAQTKSHEVFTKQQVATFANVRDDLIDESDRWESEAEEWKESNADLEGALSQSTKRSKGKEQEMAKLESRLESALTDTESHKQALIKSQDQMTELKGSLEEAKRKNEELQGNVDTLSENYKKVKQFSVKMKQLDLAVT
jgi:chromosome segregation ATPase